MHIFAEIDSFQASFFFYNSMNYEHSDKNPSTCVQPNPMSSPEISESNKNEVIPVAHGLNSSTEKPLF